MQKPPLLQSPGIVSKLFRCLVFFLTGSLVPANSMATNFQVSNVNDAGAGSLRRAISNANAAVPHTLHHHK